MSVALKIALSDDLSKVLVTIDMRKDAQRFYDGLGFKNSHEGYKLEL